MINIVKCASFLLIFQTAISQNLQLNLDVGKTYNYTSSATGIMNFKIDGENITYRNKVDGKMSFTVLKEEQNIYEMDVKFLSIYMESGTDVEKVIYDSKNENDYAFLSILIREFIDKSFKFELERTGIVKAVDIEHTINGLLDSIPLIPNFQKVQIIKRFKKVYGEKAFKGTIEMIG